jgi:hypothetical protein
LLEDFFEADFEPDFDADLDDDFDADFEEDFEPDLDEDFEADLRAVLFFEDPLRLAPLDEDEDFFEADLLPEDFLLEDFFAAFFVAMGLPPHVWRQTYATVVALKDVRFIRLQRAHPASSRPVRSEAPDWPAPLKAA